MASGMVSSFAIPKFTSVANNSASSITAHVTSADGTVVNAAHSGEFLGQQHHLPPHQNNHQRA
jgi:hypothetical protein